jgi:hypothetical protein
MLFRSASLLAAAVVAAAMTATPASAITWTCTARNVTLLGALYGPSYTGSASGLGLGLVQPRAREKARTACVAGTGKACAVVPFSCKSS